MNNDESKLIAADVEGILPGKELVFPIIVCPEIIPHINYWKKFLAEVQHRKATDPKIVAPRITKKRNKQIDKAQRRIKKWNKKLKEHENKTNS